MNSWGKHLIVDAAECRKGYRSEAAIEQFARELVRRIGMVSYGPPLVEHFGHEDPKTSGYTLVQLIETSNITAHFCDATGDAYFDVFSCRDFDEVEVMRVITEFFEPRDATTMIVERQAPSPETIAQMRADGCDEMKP